LLTQLRNCEKTADAWQSLITADQQLG
jgi:hypothetical protein